jgi:DNA-directed RNA polymerase specialized sigma24 family protein
MNAILEYAITHRAEACGILVGRYGVSPDDAEDIVQTAMLKVLQADPRDPKNDISRRAYWLTAIQTVVYEGWRRRKVRPTEQPFVYGEDGAIMTDMEDRRQDCARQAEAAETMREAQTIATPRERDALQVALTVRKRSTPNWAKQRLHHLRKRLRAAAA